MVSMKLTSVTSQRPTNLQGEQLSRRAFIHVTITDRIASVYRRRIARCWPERTRSEQSFDRRRASHCGTNVTSFRV